MSIPLRKTSLDVFAVREEAFEVVYWCKDFVAGVFMFYSSVPRVNVKPEVGVGKKKIRTSQRHSSRFCCS
jgi:hypothetical protein